MVKIKKIIPSTSYLTIPQGRENLAVLLKIAEDIQSINTTIAFLRWDLDTYMPPSNSSYRAWQINHLNKAHHDLITSPKLASLIDCFQQKENHKKLSKIEKALVKLISKEIEKIKNVPLKIEQELDEVKIHTYLIWDNAFLTDDFNAVLSGFEKIISLNRQIAEFRGYKNSPYDVLVQNFEPEITTKELDLLFKKLKEELIPILRKISNTGKKINTDFLCKVEEDKLLIVLKQVLNKIGFDMSRGRLDKSIYPFSTILGSNDIRLTSHHRHIWNSMSATLHEGGHALYSQGIDTALSKTPLYEEASYGIDESQSRLYETIIGHSFPFCKFIFPLLKEHFPNELHNVKLEDFYHAINEVTIDHLWDGDEITYNIHVIIRYEIEKDLIEGKLQPKDAPKAYASKVKEYLGFDSPNENESAMQVAHWYDGDIGYFPAYTLGNLYAAQIYHQAKKEIPNLEEEIANGNFHLIKKWLNDKIHFVGKTEIPKEIILRVTGEELNPEYFIRYVKEKYSKIYNVDL